MERTKAYRCVECNAVSEETAGVAIYECQECSGKFSKNNGLGKGHICPNCTNKMGTKLDGEACAECEEGETEEVDTLRCEWCDELIDEENIEEHLAGEHARELAEYYITAEKVLA